MASANEKFTGKTGTHPQLSRVIVNRPVENSRVLIDVTVLDRGKGWDESKQRYKGVKTSSGWYRGQNREFGTSHEINYKEFKTE